MLHLPALSPFGSRTLDVQSLVRCFWALVWVAQALCGKKPRAGSQEALQRYPRWTPVYAICNHTSDRACIDSFLPCAANSVHRLESNLLEQARQRDTALRSLILEHNLSVLRRIDQLEGELANAQRPVLAARLHSSLVHPKDDAFEHKTLLDAPGAQLEALPELQAVTPEQAGGPAPSSTALRALDIDEAPNAAIIPVSKAGRKRKAESCASPHGRKRHGGLVESAA